MEGSVSGEQLDAIVDAYKTVDAACGRKPGTDPIEPQKLPDPVLRHSLFSVLAPELHDPGLYAARETLVNNTREAARSLAPGASVWEMLTYNYLTLCALLGVEQQRIDDVIKAWTHHVSDNAAASRFRMQACVPQSSPMHKPVAPQKKCGFDLLENLEGMRPYSEKPGKHKFNFENKHAVIATYRPLGVIASSRYHDMATAIGKRYVNWVQHPEKAPGLAAEVPWISFFAAVNILSTLYPAFGMDIAPELYTDSDFINGPLGRIFLRNYKTLRDESNRLGTPVEADGEARASP